MCRDTMRLIVTAGTCAWLALSAVDVAAFAPVRQAHVEAELVAEHVAIGRFDSAVTVGLRMKMDDRWHTYWENPGVAGLATSIQWDLPEGFKAGAIQWPCPQRFEVSGLVGYGYEGEVLLPVQITLPEQIDSHRVEFMVHVRWLACKEACVPGQATLKLELPVIDERPAMDTRWQALFGETRRKLPTALSAGGLVYRDGDRLVLVVAALEQDANEIPKATFFASEPDVIEYAAPQHAQWHDRQLTLLLKRSQTRQAPVEQLRGVLVVENVGQPQVLEIDEPVRADRTDVVATEGLRLSLPLAMFYALLGGLLLNLMPCVFPVLSIKVLRFVQQASEQPVQVRIHGLVFGLGVLLSFWALGAVFIAFRAGGEQLGWGFQLQNPQFVSVMALLMFAVGLNLAGVFEFGLSVSVLAGRQVTGTQTGTYAGSFFSGVLATAVATPCTAPFMGPAVGFALALPGLHTLAVLTALGVGMALPYVVLSMFPLWLGLLPRAGPWMQTFKQLMAFPMFGAAIWLAWVFDRQMDGANGILFLLMGMLVLGMAAWIFGRWGSPTSTPTKRWTARGLGAGLAVVAAMVPMSAPVGLDWESFSAQRVEQLRSEGRVVFVDFTADWCLTCLFNERTVLISDEVRDAFEEYNVVLLRADWTQKDEHVTQALAGFGRGSVPLYVVYSPDQSQQPNVLPTVITSRMVREAIAQAVPSTTTFMHESSRD